LKPAFALVSMNMIPNSRDFASPSSIETCLFQYQNGFVKKISDGEIKILEWKHKRQAGW